jgi:hypothetical protein
MMAETKDRPRIAVMQPYTFPSLGYYQLAAATDRFCFYDDVNFIRGGWINRNRILQGGTPVYFTVPLAKQSQNVRIDETMVALSDRNRDKISASIRHAYSRSPYRDTILDLAMTVLVTDERPISELAAQSVRAVFDYLGLGPEFCSTSQFAPETQGLDRVERLVTLTRKAGGTHYVNSIGGQELYDKETFSKQGIRLSFLQSRMPEYPQHAPEFVPNLSIIDVLMSLPPGDVRALLGEWDLV